MSAGSNGGSPLNDGTHAFVQIEIWVHDRLLECHPFAYKLYAHIRLKYWNRKEGRAWPSREDLAADLHVSPSTVWRGIDALREAGVMRTVERRRHGYVAGLDFYLFSSPDEVAASHTAKPLNGTAVVVQGEGEGLLVKNDHQESLKVKNDNQEGRLKVKNDNQEGRLIVKNDNALVVKNDNAIRSRSSDPDLRRRSLDHLDYSKRVAITQVSLSSSRKAFQAQPDDDDGRPETDAEVRERMRADLARQRVARVARR